MNDESGAVEPSQYYVRVRGKVTGPFNMERLQTMRNRGQLSRIHEVSADKRSWQSAASLFVAASTSSQVDDQDLNLKLEAPYSSDSRPPEPANNKLSWYYHVGEEMHGPVSLMELRSLVSSRQLTADELVWKEGFADWILAAEVPELRHLFSGSGPPNGVPHPASGRYSKPEPSYYPPSQDAMPRTSGLAVAGITLGILGLLIGFLSVFAIIFSSVALKEINRSNGMLTGKGMAISGLITGILGAVGWAIWLCYLIDRSQL